MGDDPLKQIVADVAAATPIRKGSRSNRTLSLSEPNFKLLQDHCREHGVKVSEVVDRLIKSFLEAAGKKSA